MRYHLCRVGSKELSPPWILTTSDQSHKDAEVDTMKTRASNTGSRGPWEEVTHYGGGFHAARCLRFHVYASKFHKTSQKAEQCV